MRHFLLSVGISALCVSAAAQKDKDVVTGNGKLITRDVPVQSFSQLKASGVYELKLSQGDRESVKIEADENLQEYFTVKNEGDKLVIDMKKMNNKNMRLKSKMRVYVTFKQLRDVELSTVGNVKSDETLSFSDLKLDNKSVGNVDLNLTANKLNITSTSVGNMNLKGKAESAQFINSGVGNLDAGDFVVQTVSIENTGVGNAEVHAVKECKVKDSMMGKVRNRGNAPVRKGNKVVI